jgi:hypothetical protein
VHLRDTNWGYNRLMTVEGLFRAGDTIGGTAHKFSSSCCTEGRIAAKAAVNYVNDLGREQPELSEEECEDFKKTIYQPLENYQVGRNEIVAAPFRRAVFCRSMVFSASRKSWTNTSAVSARITRPTSLCSPAGWNC